MVVKMGKLTAKKVENAKPGRYSDGEGLMLLVKPTGGKSWVLRVQMAGKRRDIGLGSASAYNAVHSVVEEIPLLEKRVLTLAEARMKAAIRQSPTVSSGKDSATADPLVLVFL
jgi:hypothetical protein